MIVILSKGDVFKDSNGFLHECNSRVIQKRVNSLRDASNKVTKYIEDNCLGASCFTGGDVLGDDGKKIAWISYNGRVWDLDNNLIPLS